MIIKVW